MSEYEKFNTRVSKIEEDVSDLKVGQAKTHSALSNGILSNLKDINKKLDSNKIEAMDNRRVDREIVIALKTVVEAHLKNHSGVLGNLKYIVTACIAIAGVVIALL